MHSWKKETCSITISIGFTLWLSPLRLMQRPTIFLVKLTILSITTTTPPMLMTFTMMVM